ncbi:MAG: hypothetical protein FJZ15_05320 [Candidatus Omnitrophica bacterium]|nr:hypothetical protein [Candidatus Omnitrophota bacterium]
MLKHLKKIDIFSKNIIVVFLATTLVNVFNLLYQLLIAHKLSPEDFASFNALISIFMLVSAPLANLQTVVAKYISEFRARQEKRKLKVLMTQILKRTLFFSVVSFFIIYLLSPVLMRSLKIPSNLSGPILAVTIALSWITPVLLGSLQGFELFSWLSSVSVIGGFLKLLFAAIFLYLGFSIAGAVGALMFSGLIITFILVIPLKDVLNFKTRGDGINFREIFMYLIPVGVTSFCYMGLVNSDMIMVKYYFPSFDSGVYSLAQMVGKIFLFLPAAISVVMFPKTSGLNAKSMDTTQTLKKSLIYGGILCLAAAFAYNLFPEFILKILTGKYSPEAISLGRFFSISMSFFTLLYILEIYFLSISDLRFLKYLIAGLFCQLIAIAVFHVNLGQVAVVLLINSILLFLFHLKLVKFNR